MSVGFLNRPLPRFQDVRSRRQRCDLDIYAGAGALPQRVIGRMRYLTRYSRASDSDATVGGQMGHANPATTQGYAGWAGRGKAAVAPVT